ncbi:hypothetical protein DFH28DRAFT_895665, partial [Melampsora americana]
MDGLITADLTGQTPTTTPKTPSFASKTRPPSSKTLDKVTIPTQALLNTGSNAPASLESSRKRQRHRAPSPSPLDESKDITGTPRSARIARLFPGGSKPLGVLVQRLLDISKAALIPKSKRAKAVNVDVESAADILVIASLLQDQANVMESRRVVFDPNRHTAPTPTFSASNAQFEFRHEALSEKVDTLTNQMAKLVSAIIPDQQHQQSQPGQPKSSYALAASKHAPKASQAPKNQQQGARADPKKSSRPRSEASLTLTQQDPKSIAGEGKSIPELIKTLNEILKTNNIKVELSDNSPILVRNIHRHPSGDLVIYVES